MSSTGAAWHYPKPGTIASAAAPMVYLVSGATVSDGDLVAIKLE